MRFGKVAVMAVDPGVTTGVARGVFDLDMGSVRECIAAGLDLESFDVTGVEREQGMTLAIEFADWVFRANVEHGVPVGRVILVIEDWTPRLPLKSGARDVFYPVRVPALMEGFCGQVGAFDSGLAVWQQPSVAKTFATDRRLRAVGLWVRGRDHQRDAWRHVMAYLNGVLT